MPKKRVKGNKEMGRIREHERIKETMELASVLMLVKTPQSYSSKSSVGPLSHAGNIGARLCFVTSTFQTTKSL
jgi:hypothetical protein